MAERERIIVGVDGSEASLDAVRWALRQAELTGSSVEALISWQFPRQYGEEFYGEEFDWEKIATDTLRSSLAQLGDEAQTRIEPRVVQGHPAQALVKASAGASLLVVGSRGHGGFVGMLIGSVSEHVIAHAQCPVLVVRHHEDS
jgi:nucleotide-binding universal stress UspA family protein